jgi:hypothetical protein
MALFEMHYPIFNHVGLNTFKKSTRVIHATWLSCSMTLYNAQRFDAFMILLLTQLQYVTENPAPVKGSVTPFPCVYIGASCPPFYSSPEHQKQQFYFVAQYLGSMDPVVTL